MNKYKENCQSSRVDTKEVKLSDRKQMLHDICIKKTRNQWSLTEIVMKIWCWQQDQWIIHKIVLQIKSKELFSIKFNIG
jgi:hypothetical protein